MTGTRPTALRTRKDEKGELGLRSRPRATEIRRRPESRATAWSVWDQS